MNKGRLEAFSDGVIAVIITIMVLELKVPHGDGVVALGPLVPVFLSYVLSFVYVGIYWNNHHHMLYLVAIPLAFLSHWIAQALYVAVALMWLVPDRRIERAMTNGTEVRERRA
jgi:uncharacterized membrane protein